MTAKIKSRDIQSLLRYTENRNLSKEVAKGLAALFFPFNRKSARVDSSVIKEVMGVRLDSKESFRNFSLALQIAGLITVNEGYEYTWYMGKKLEHYKEHYLAKTSLKPLVEANAARIKKLELDNERLSIDLASKTSYVKELLGECKRMEKEIKELKDRLDRLENKI